jgi:hypothetical protein
MPLPMLQNPWAIWKAALPVPRRDERLFADDARMVG